MGAITIDILSSCQVLNTGVFSSQRTDVRVPGWLNPVFRFFDFWTFLFIVVPCFLVFIGYGLVFLCFLVSSFVSLVLKYSGGMDSDADWEIRFKQFFIIHIGCTIYTWGKTPGNTSLRTRSAPRPHKLHTSSSTFAYGVQESGYRQIGETYLQKRGLFWSKHEKQQNSAEPGNTN